MRKLTGRWYLKKNWLGFYKPMVEIVRTITNPQDLSESPEFKKYVKANTDDLVELIITGWSQNESERDRDRLVGKYHRKILDLEERIRKHNHFIWERKREAGYHDSVSFDVVWEETLDRAKKNELITVLTRKDLIKSSEDKSMETIEFEDFRSFKNDAMIKSHLLLFIEDYQVKIIKNRYKLID